MTTLVTGAGLLGTAFAQAASARDERIVFLDPFPRAAFLRQKLGPHPHKLVAGDVRNLPDLIEAIDKHAVDTVIHTAGMIGSRVQREIGLAFEIGINGTRNVAEAVRLTGVRRLVHLSTFGAYDWSRPLPTRIDESFPLGADRAYGAFKVAKEQILLGYLSCFDFELVMLRPANVYGFGHFWSGSGGGIRMQKLMQAGLGGEVAKISAAEAIDVEMVYAKDVGRALDCAATAPKPKDIAFNIGTGGVTPFAALIDTVAKVYPGLRIEREPGEPKASRIAPLDISRAKAQLGWEPSYGLLAGLQDYRAELEAAARAD